MEFEYNNPKHCKTTQQSCSLWPTSVKRQDSSWHIQLQPGQKLTRTPAAMQFPPRQRQRSPWQPSMKTVGQGPAVHEREQNRFQVFAFLFQIFVGDTCKILTSTQNCSQRSNCLVPASVENSIILINSPWDELKPVRSTKHIMPQIISDSLSQSTRSYCSSSGHLPSPQLRFDGTCTYHVRWIKWFHHVSSCFAIT